MKKTYQTPEVKVFFIQTEDALLQTSGKHEDYGEAITDEWD